MAQKTITRAEYMSNSNELHQDFYAQFITEGTKRFILDRIGLDKLKQSKDPRFNDIAKHSNGGRGSWVWDFTPMNIELARELGAVGKNCLPSPATHTCVGKACARLLLSSAEASD